jgi:AcrR family transcriptional regulator
MAQRTVVPRGRHAPPLHVRKDRQRTRLHEAAGAVFARMGYADATAELIAREAGMSKATFYEHFDNKEDCICALFDAALEQILAALQAGERRTGADGDPYRPSIELLIAVITEHPAIAQTLLIEIIGAGPRASERRDRFLEQLAAYVDQRNATSAAAGQTPRFASPHDAFAIVGGVVELLSRQLRTGVPADVRELEPVVVRLVNAVIAAGDEPQ